MEADICNGRFDFDHSEHCEVYKEHAVDEATRLAKTGDD
jgi:hypothetical protein